MFEKFTSRSCHGKGMVFKSGLAITISLSGAMAGNVLANEIEAALGSDHVDFRFTSDFEQDFSGRLALMHSEEDDVDSNVVSYTFATRGQREGFDISLGGRVFWADVESDDALGLALGFGVSYELAPKFETGVEVYYSPDILTSGDLDSSLDLEFRASYQVIDNGSVFLGFRKLEAEHDSNIDFDIVDGAVLGMRLSF